MINKSVIRAIGDKEMDRKDFLKYSGFALLTLIGLKSIVSLLIQTDDKTTLVDSHKDTAKGFGGGRYGV